MSAALTVLCTGRPGAAQLTILLLTPCHSRSFELQERWCGPHSAGQVFPSQNGENDYISKEFPFPLEGEVRGRAKQLLLCMI